MADPFSAGKAQKDTNARHSISNSSIKTYHARKPGMNSVAKPIETGLARTGDDARRFPTYREDPTIAQEGRTLIREAGNIAKKEKLSPPSFQVVQPDRNGDRRSKLM